jgi:hypothetical protein
MGLMNLLAELHAEPDLKLNLKFEIEVSALVPVFRIQNLCGDPGYGSCHCVAHNS